MPNNTHALRAAVNSPPIVSVIVAAYNQEKYVGRCIRSLLSQTRPRDSYEIIVINDGSTDRTKYALELFEEDLRVLHNPERRGLPIALNQGIRLARGQFVVRVDADDYVHTEYINILLLFLMMNKHMDAAACDYMLVDDSENVLGVMDGISNPIGCGIMFRVEHLIEIGLYDENFLAHEEKDLRLRFQQTHQIHRVPLPLYRYRRHENNMTNNIQLIDGYTQRLHQKHGGKEAARAK